MIIEGFEGGIIEIYKDLKVDIIRLIVVGKEIVRIEE